MRKTCVGLLSIALLCFITTGCETSPATTTTSHPETIAAHSAARPAAHTAPATEVVRTGPQTGTNL